MGHEIPFQRKLPVAYCARKRLFTRVRRQVSTHGRPVAEGLLADAARPGTDVGPPPACMLRLPRLGPVAGPCVVVHGTRIAGTLSAVFPRACLAAGGLSGRHRGTSIFFPGHIGVVSTTASRDVSDQKSFPERTTLATARLAG